LIFLLHREFSLLLSLAALALPSEVRVFNNLAGFPFFWGFLFDAHLLLGFHFPSRGHLAFLAAIFFSCALPIRGRL